MNQVTIDDFQIGFEFQQLIENQWKTFVIKTKLSEKEKQYIQDLISKNLVRKMEEQKTIEEKPTWFSIFYSALFSFAFLIIFIICVQSLNYIDLHYGSTAEGMVMPSGIKLLQLILTVGGFHTGALTIANIVDWTDSNFKSYEYRNPKLFKSTFDKYQDLNNSECPKAKYRLQWFGKRFYTFYFVSVGLLLIIYTLKVYLGVN